MGKPSGLLVASYLFLILSVAPIDAARVQAGKHTIATSLSTQAVANSESDWHVFSTHEENCARWQREFVQRSAQVESLRAQIAAGNAGNLKTAQAVLRLRSMTRTYERAARQECQWVAERDVDATALNTTVHEGLGENPCFPQAQALLTQEFETQQQQITAMLLATRFLTTRECDQAAADRFAAEIDAPSDSDGEVTVEEQIEAANDDADTQVDTLVEELMDPNSTSLIQLTDGAQFIPVLEELVGLVAFLLIWAVMCVIFIPVIIMVIGAVLCTLSWVIRRFLNNFGTSNLGSCMNWWAHQTQLMFSPGNELITAGACFIAGWFGAIPNLNIHANFPNLGIYIRR